MDEEEILRSSLEQSNTIDIGNFFGTPTGGLANRALMQSNRNLKASEINRNLITALQTSFQTLKSGIQQITNYILVDKQERSKILQQRELEEFEREDDIQKGLVRPESAQPRSLEDAQPFFPENRFSQGLTAGMSSIGEPRGVAKFQQEVMGSKPFFLGGLVPGFGNADTVNAKLTPGEFIIPKEKVEEVGANPLMNFIKGIGNSIRNFDGRPGSRDFDKVPDSSAKFGEIVTYLQNLEKSGASKEEVLKLQKSIFSEKLKNSKNARWSNIYNQKIDESDKYFQTGKFDPEKTGYRTTKGTIYDTDKSEIENYKLSDKQEKIIANKLADEHASDSIPSNLINEKGEVTGSYSTYPTDDEFSVTAKDENKRGLFGAIGGTIDAATGNLTDFDRRGGKPFGLMRGLTGTIDAATGGLTDLDRRGGKPFGLMRGLTGSIDAMTGGLTDLDRRGGKPFGTMRLATGVADAMTRNLFDFDRRGKGEEMTKGFSTYPIEDNLDNIPSNLINKKGEMTGGYSTFPIDKRKEEKRLITVNYNEKLKEALERREGYIESGDQSRLVGVDRKINIYKNKLKSGITEEQVLATVKPEKEKSKNLTLGERFMNIFKGKEMKEGFSTYPSNISSDDSIKTAAKGIIQPPPSPESETVVLPESSAAETSVNSIDQTSTSPFTSPTPSHAELGPTNSPVPFIDVISNQYLSVV